MAIDPFTAPAPAPEPELDAPSEAPAPADTPDVPEVPAAPEGEPEAPHDAPQEATDGPATPASVIDPATTPPTRPFVPQPDILCAGCGGVLVHHDPVTGQALLSVYERQLLRPHRLSADDYPLDWRCQVCGHQQVINNQ